MTLKNLHFHLALPTILFLFIGLLITTVPNDSYAQDIFLQGTVTDRDTGLPIEGAEVFEGNQLRTTTDASGNYSLTGEEITNLNGGIVVRAPGYLAGQGSFNIQAPLPNILDVTLAPSFGNLVEGTITDATTGAPIQNARIRCNGDFFICRSFTFFQSSNSTETDSAGFYSYDSSLFRDFIIDTFNNGLQNDTIFIQVTADGYFTENINMEFPLLTLDSLPIIMNASLICRTGECAPAQVCGNGTPEGTEQCDQGAANGSPASCCDANCNFKASNIVCRGDSGSGCDVAEMCTGSSADCPADGFESAGTECRASAGECDVAESCTGSSASCPGDSFESSDTVCRSQAGDCDIAETCSGSGAACPADAFEPSTTECRGVAGICDIAESCTGSGAACPSDQFESTSTSCRGAVNTCDIEEFCDGLMADCPSDEFEPPETVCSADQGPDGICLDNACVNEGVITIIKEAYSPDEEDGADFEFSCTDSTTAACAGMGDENGMFLLDDPIIDDLDLVTDTETSDPMFIGEYTIEEIIPIGWQLDMIECIDDEDGETIANADAANVLINLDPAEEVMCTFFNSDIPVRIAGFNNKTKMQVIKNRQNKVKVTGITPERNIKLAWGIKKGTSFMNGGICQGAEFSIRKHKIIATLKANDQGNLNKRFFVPSTSARIGYLQPIDMGNCMVGARKEVKLLNN